MVDKTRTGTCVADHLSLTMANNSFNPDSTKMEGKDMNI
jgi:hypothetical protein